MSVVLTVTAKGQVTFRKDLLEYLGVGPGGKLTVDLLPDGRAVVSAPRGGIDRFIGSLRRPDTPVLSVDAMTDVAARGWAGER